MSFDLKALIAQTHLAHLGLYKGDLDGQWGPLSMAAAEAWDDAKVMAAIPPASSAATAATPYSLARTHIGTREIPGSKNNPLIVTWLRRISSWVNDDETAWCAAFVNAMAAEAGYEQSGKLNARSFMEVGIPIALENAKPGDVVVFWRVAKDSWEGHVAFFVSYDPHSQLVRVLGGNQSDSVSITNYSRAQLLGIRRLRTLDSLQGKTSARI
jgi:uncharacterized protein (TIGR02594 family)